MANRIRGEAAFDGADGQSYRLVLDFNAWAEVEDVLDMEMEDVLREMQERRRLKFLRAILYGALRKHHADITLAGAGDLMAEGAQVGEAILKAMHGSLPEPREGVAAGAVANPPTAGVGTSAKQPGRKKA